MRCHIASVVAFITLLVAARETTAQSVVVNEFRNQTPDAVELLVIQNNLDMRGMIVKDYSSSGANDGGGAYTFSTDTLWSSLPAGTLIVLRKDSTAADVTVGGSDYNLDVGLQNTTYFAVGSGTFDIASEELVQIKASGNVQAGSAGAIHTLASAGAGAQYTSSPTPKLKASTGNSGTGESVEAGNGTQALVDFDGTDATGDGAAGSLGTWNNANNQAYITTLRGGGGGGETTNVQFTASSASVSEAAGTAQITVYKTSTNGNVTAHIQLGGTAANPADYSIDTTNVTLNGAVTSQTVTVSIADDGDIESAETVTLTIANVAQGQVGSPSVYTLTITDNDTPAPSGQPWINEVDYDTIGTDSNEWVEIAGPAGLSLNDYELLMISDAGVAYLTNDLAGASYTFTDVESGYGFFVIGRVNPAEGTADYTPATWTTDKIQNGPSDSIQLRQKAGAVNVHLLDYEGNNSSTTEDQSTTVNDDNTTALKSIFLTGGPGSGFASFSWTNTAGGATPGALNGGQTLEASSITTNVKFTASSASAGEASVSYTVTVYKTVADGAVTGQVALSGTATGSGLDYSVDTTNFTLNGATTSATFVVSLQDDAEVESAETVILTLTGVTGAGVASPSVFTLTITDNDVGQSPPTLAAIGNKVGLTNSAISFGVTATPTDGDTVTLSVSNAPAGSTFGFTNEIGTFTWLSPAPAGVYTTTFYAADNDGIDSEQITITVTSSPAPLNLGVWINELHYDNGGADSDEGFEIAGLAGTDLSNFSLVLYNGSVGTPGGVYSNLTVTGTIDNESNGYGALWFGFGGAFNQVFNGVDAVALVYNGSQVIQFLSYEGVVVATNGPADGLTSTDIGVTEGLNTQVNWSLQLCGTGTNYADYAWSTNLPHSRGDLNACQVIPAPGDPNDGDGDGLPNQWENQYFGSTTAGNPYDDDDDDGFYNIEEFVAGTIPVLAGGGNTNYFRSASFAISGGTVGYPSMTGRLYRLWSNTNFLGAQTWSQVGGPQLGNGSVQSLQDTSGSTSPAYRLTVEMETP